MSWNNGLERKKFKRKQEKQIEQYKSLGMTEEQINEIVAFDEEQFRSDRRYQEHTQDFSDSLFDADDGEDNGHSPLYSLFFDQLTETIDDGRDKMQPFSWVEDLQNTEMYNTVLSLREEDRMLLTLLIEEKREVEIAEFFGVSQPAVAKRIRKIRERFRQLR